MKSPLSDECANAFEYMYVRKACFGSKDFRQSDKSVQPTHKISTKTRVSREDPFTCKHMFATPKLICDTDIQVLKV